MTSKWTLTMMTVMSDCCCCDDDDENGDDVNDVDWWRCSN
jgi:hypothetical protein